MSIQQQDMDKPIGFSQEWNERYAENTHMSIWPWSDLVSYVMRYAKPGDKRLKVLELGCGAGANIPFFQSLNVDYSAIEGSDVIVAALKKRFPNLAGRIAIDDFTVSIPFEESFDLIIDRSALTFNTTESIKKCLSIVREKLNVGGKFIGIDWFSTQHSDFFLGNTAEDEYTKTSLLSGQLAKLGRVHFSDEQHLRGLFSDFTIEVMEHKIVQSKSLNYGHEFAAWNFVAVKK